MEKLALVAGVLALASAASGHVAAYNIKSQIKSPTPEVTKAVEIENEINGLAHKTKSMVYSRDSKGNIRYSEEFLLAESRPIIQDAWKRYDELKKEYDVHVAANPQVIEHLRYNERLRDRIFGAYFVGDGIAFLLAAVAGLSWLGSLSSAPNRRQTTYGKTTQ